MARVRRDDRRTQLREMQVGYKATVNLEAHTMGADDDELRKICIFDAAISNDYNGEEEEKGLIELARTKHQQQW